MTDRYAVMGYPIAHSKSPRIHTWFARQTGEPLSYDAIAVEPGMFQAAVNGFFAGDGRGLNITVPFKREAWELAALHGPEAALAGAVNTLWRDAEGQLHGHNTDGIGLVRDILQNHGGSLAGKTVLVLGAGGATRGILLPLLQQQPARLCIANRTVSRAEQLVALFERHGSVEACGFAGLNGQRFDWVLNATAASLQGELPPLPADLLRPGAWCYDLMYAAEPTVFCRWALAHGAARALDGLGMLVEQAAESFHLWRGIRPDTAPLLVEMLAER